MVCKKETTEFVYPSPSPEKCPQCGADFLKENSVKREYKHKDSGENVVDHGEIYKLTKQFRFKAFVDGRFYEVLDDSDSCVSCGHILESE